MCLSICNTMIGKFSASEEVLKLAEDVCRRIIEKSTNKSPTNGHLKDARIMFCSALIKEKQQQYEQALAEYAAIEVACKEFGMRYHDVPLSSNPKAHIRIAFFNELLGEVALRKAIIKVQMGLDEEAMNICHILSIKPLSSALKLNVLCYQGYIYEQQSQFPAAEVAYQSVLQHCPSHCGAHERLARMYLRYKETTPEAAKCLYKILEVNPAHSGAWYLVGRCHMHFAQFNDAHKAFEQSINIDPNNAQTWCSLGVLYHSCGQYKEALGMLSRALKLEPDMPDAWYNVAVIYEINDSREDALEAYTKAEAAGLASRLAHTGLPSPLPMTSASATAATTTTTSFETASK